MKLYDAGLANIANAKSIIDKDLEQFVAQWRLTHSDGSADAIDAYCQVLLTGGKRLRGILAMQSYYAHGGADDAVAIGAARVLELIQAYLLVIDDIADRSATRRGGPSAHRRIETVAHEQYMRGDLAHYSQAQAMNAALCGAHQASLELLRLPVADAIIRRAMVSLHKNTEITGTGQINDMFNEATSLQLDEAAIERVLTQKSAYYTFVNPLELGACLAGRDVLNESLHTYAVNIGCTFQISDDLIGSFGSEAEIGKSANDDIREGKMTLIAQYALANANDDGYKRLRHILGDMQATDEDCDDARVIFKLTGAYSYAIHRRDWYARQARDALSSAAGVDTQFIAFLEELIDYVVNRQS